MHTINDVHHQGTLLDMSSITDVQFRDNIPAQAYNCQLLIQNFVMKLWPMHTIINAQFHNKALA